MRKMVLTKSSIRKANYFLKLSANITYLENKKNENETKKITLLAQLAIMQTKKYQKSNTIIIRQWIVFDNCPKDQVFETYLVFKDEYLLKKYEEEIMIDSNNNYCQIWIMN